MTTRIELLRPDDLLNLHIEAVNLRLDMEIPDAPALIVEDAAQPAQLIVTFPPQSIAERAFFEADEVPPDSQKLKQSPTIDPKTGLDRTSTDPLDPPGQVPARSAHPSRLVFDVPADARIRFTTEGLLDWTGLELRVSPLAAIPPTPNAEQIAQAPTIAAPAANETALELPYRLLISPNRDVRWLHRFVPFSHAGRTELWHTRLALVERAQGEAPEGTVELSRQHTAPLRAIWSPDYQTAKGKPTDEDKALGLTAMSPNDRHQIVILTSAFHGYEVKHTLPFFAERAASHLFGGFGSRFTPFVPDPFYATQLMLSPLGGWLKSRGTWDPPHEVRTPPLRFEIDEIIKQAVAFENFGRPLAHAEPEGDLLRAGAAAAAQSEQIEFLDLSEWTHVATQGRDHYVRIVYEGVLWPFGHRAALIKVTERKFRDAGGIVGAYLMQRMFIVVREPEKRFPDGDLAMPLKKVRLTTLVTPNIAKPKYEVENLRAFWVEVLKPGNERARFPFHAIGEDGGHNRVDFTAPLMFVSVAVTGDNALRQAVADHYNNSSSLELLQKRSIHVPGQHVLYAEADGNDNTRLVTQTMTFVVERARAVPQLMTAEVSVPAVQAITGEGKTVPIRLYAPYVSGGPDAGAGVFAEIAKFDPAQYKDENPLAVMAADTVGVNFSAEQAGGFATPNMAVSTLTRKLGPLAGKAADAAADAFNPNDFFKKGMAQLFGTFDLMDLLNPGPPASKNAPQLKIRREPISATEERVIATLDWEPEVRNRDLVIAAFKKDRADKTTELKVHGIIEKKLSLQGPAGDATFEFRGTLNDFIVTVLKSVIINFVEFGFVARSGAKPYVTVKLDEAKPVEFAGPLKFVEEIRTIIPPGLFGKGASLDIAPTGIRAGFAIALPPVAVGVFALKDVSLGAALTLPILGEGRPTFDFNVSERAHPFLLAVAIFGGGGFFRLQLDTAGMRALEISLEFGAAASIDLGLASGGVHIMAGIYFALQRNEANEMRATLTGFLRMGGYLSVLGLIKVSLEFNLSFTYKEKGKAWGRAELTIEVQIACFSKSVTLTLERQFGGSSGDPKFAELFDTQDVWSEYAGAFA